MNITNFLSEVHCIFGPNIEETPVRIQDPFPSVEGLTTPEIGLLLNFACRNLCNGEAYLEVGSFKGKSALLATRNVRSPAYFVDNCSVSAETEIARNWKLNNKHWGIYDFIFRDYRKVLHALSFKHKVGVYFYDGPHAAEDQYEGLKLVKPLLASSAVIFVDDFREPFVSEPSMRWVEENESASLITYLPSPANCSRPWWNGLGIIKWSSK